MSVIAWILVAHGSYGALAQFGPFADLESCQRVQRLQITQWEKMGERFNAHCVQVRILR